MTNHPLMSLIKLLREKQKIQNKIQHKTGIINLLWLFNLCNFNHQNTYLKIVLAINK